MFIPHKNRVQSDYLIDWLINGISTHLEIFYDQEIAYIVHLFLHFLSNYLSFNTWLMILNIPI